MSRPSQNCTRCSRHLSSPRGQYLHRRLLHSLRGALTIEEIERLRKELGVEEYERHVNKLTKWGLIELVRSTERMESYPSGSTFLY